MRRSWLKKNDGTGLQDRIKTMARIYEQRGILTLEKVDPPTFMQRINGHYVAVQKASPFLDFVGAIICAGGRALFLEAKSGDEPRLAFGGFSGLTKTQLESLIRWDRCGAVAGVLYEHRGGPSLEFYWLGVPEIAAAQAEGRKSVPLSAMERVPPGVSLLADFWQNVSRRHFAPTPG